MAEVQIIIENTDSPRIPQLPKETLHLGSSPRNTRSKAIEMALGN